MKMIIQICLFVLCVSMGIKAQEGNTPVVYLIPGQGSDARLFSNLVLDSIYDVRYIHYHTPHDTLSMFEFARELSQQIDTNEDFVIIGVSLGGMLATEMTEFLDPEKVILISSAKHRYELPKRYTFQSQVPIHSLIPGKLAKIGAQFMQPIVEPDRNNEKEICKQMLADKDPAFLRHTIDMIINWERKEAPDTEIIHIHGDNDHTIPIRNVKYDYKIENGSHMMVLTRGEELSKLLNKLLQQH